MKLLVIGGSYFYGRVFVMEAAKEHDITVWNRGTYSMKEFGRSAARIMTPWWISAHTKPGMFEPRWNTLREKQDSIF